MIRIGEKLNGAIKIMREAIAARDAEIVRSRALQQQAAGADYLDICAAVTEGEREVMRFLIETVQEATDLPLCIDSPDPAVCVWAMKLCKRPGILNSVSMEGTKADVILPAIAGTDWSAVALLCDDAGIPATAEGRLAVLERLLARAADCGVKEEQLFIDPMVEALSANPDAFLTFSASVCGIRKAHPDLHIVSGTSNISFGLPQRKRLHGAFLHLAAEAGMDAAICDPADALLAAEPIAVDALLGNDPGCQKYLAAYAAPREEARRDTAALRLYAAVGEGRAEAAPALTQAALDAGEAPLALLDGMTETMARLGERFARGEVFIPELILASRAMQAASGVLGPLLGTNVPTRGTAVIGTVMGDMHDIGKNLVAMMLEGAGFTVVDLGTDVYPEDIVDAVRAHPDTKLIALSALLTTTMPAMRDTVSALRAEPVTRDLKIMVGGAPVTQAFADAIGADAYTDNAASAAEEAKRLTAE